MMLNAQLLQNIQLTRCLIRALSQGSRNSKKAIDEINSYSRNSIGNFRSLRIHHFASLLAPTNTV